MHITILGANGAIGSALTKQLQQHSSVKKLQLVARTFEDKKAGNITYKKADLLNQQETDDAIQGMDLVYLTVGLPYKTSIWEKQWPQIMQNVIHGCEKHNAKLVFFDNVYAYGLVQGTMTEETPLKPSSKKGQVRKHMQELIEKEIATGKLRAVILKSADYYGPHAKASMFYFANIENLLQNKKPTWMGDPSKVHSLTYIPDAIKALVIAGFDKRADNNVWHIPTAKPYTGTTYMELITKAMHKPNEFMKINKIMLWLVGLVNSQARELIEMFYQYDHDYQFDSSKFEDTFNLQPTPYEVGIKHTVASYC